MGRTFFGTGAVYGDVFQKGQLLDEVCPQCVKLGGVFLELSIGFFCRSTEGRDARRVDGAGAHITLLATAKHGRPNFCFFFDV